MKRLVDSMIPILEAVVDFVSDGKGPVVLVESPITPDEILAKKRTTPYQKAMKARRQTVAAHTHRPAKASVFYMHAVRAIFQNLRKGGESFHGAAKGGQNIARTMMTKNGYATGKETGQINLTGKGLRRNKMHAKEPAHIRDKKQKAYDYIMGIQRQKVSKQAQVQRKAVGAG